MVNDTELEEVNGGYDPYTDPNPILPRFPDVPPRGNTVWKYESTEDPDMYLEGVEKLKQEYELFHMRPDDGAIIRHYK